MNGATITDQLTYKGRKRRGPQRLSERLVLAWNTQDGIITINTVKRLYGQIRGCQAERRVVRTEAPAMLQHGRACRNLGA